MKRRRPSQKNQLSITSADRHRYRLYREGVSVAEIATRDRVTIAQVERSILRCREERQQFSQEAVEIAVRRTVLERLPEASVAISGALQATKKETVSVVVEGTEMSETVDVPDHRTRLEGNSALIQLIASIKANVPLSQVNVDARSQTQNVLGMPGMNQGNPSSAEAIIREIRSARGLALTDGATIISGANPPALEEVDTELSEEMEEYDDDDDEAEDSEEQ